MARSETDGLTEKEQSELLRLLEEEQENNVGRDSQHSPAAEARTGAAGDDARREALCPAPTHRAQISCPPYQMV
jgi:hypothetical protein